jgi:hypothetical protein
MQLVRTAIRQSIETGSLEAADNRFLGISWKGFDDPQPDGGTDDSGEGETPGDDNGGDGSSGNGEEDSDESGNDSQDPDESEVTPSQVSSSGLEPWAIGLIVAGGVIVIAMIFLCLRRSTTNGEKLDDDDGGESSASLADAYHDEVDPSGAVPVPSRASINGSIQQDDKGEDESSYDHDASEANLRAEPSAGPVTEDSFSASIEGDSRASGRSFDGPQPHEPMYSVSSQNLISQRSHVTLELEQGNDVDSASGFSNSEADDCREVPVASFRQTASVTDEVSDSAYSSYEEVVDDEYEIEYTDGSDHQKGDQWGEEDVVNQAETSLPFLAHHAQQGQTSSSFDSMRKKWENAGAR